MFRSDSGKGKFGGAVWGCQDGLLANSYEVQTMADYDLRLA